MHKNDTKVLKESLPVRLEGNNGKAVILQHGYNGYPYDMYGLAKRVNAEGYTVVVPRLPGHATCTADFRATNWRQWLNHVRNVYLDISSEFESVTMAGLSMGGTLTLLMAEEFSPDKIILLAPAVAARKKLVYFTPFLRFLIPVMKREWVPKENEPEQRLVMAREYWSHYYSAQLSGMVKLMRMAVKRLSAVECPVYVMLSEADDSIPVTAGDIIAGGVKGRFQKHILKKSPHVFFEGPENDFVVDKVAEWISEPV